MHLNELEQLNGAHNKQVTELRIGTSLLFSFFYQLCYAAVLKILTYYVRYYADVKKLCLKFDCFIKVYSLV